MKNTKLESTEEVAAFRLWVNKHNTPNGDLDSYKYKFSYCDIDGIVFHIDFKKHQIVLRLFELKTKGIKSLRQSQEWIYPFLDRILRTCDGMKFYWESDLKKMELCYKGFYIISYDGDSPDTSENIFYNDKLITRNQLLNLVRLSD